MADVIKYSTNNPTRPGLRKGNTVIGVGDGNYGPTSATGYVSGVDVPEGGYVVYSLHNNNPNAYIAYNDNDLIAIARTLGLEATNIQEIFKFFVNRSDTWVLNSTPSNTVTEGLVLRLDASNLTSYPQNTTTWHDLSGLDNNGDIKREDQFNVRGWFDYNGNSQNDEASVATVEVNTSSNGGNTVEQWIWQNEPGGNGNMPFTWWNQSWDLWSYANHFGINNGSSLIYGITNAADILIGKWNHIVTFFPNNWSSRYQDAKMWINGVAQTMAIQQGNLVNISLSASQTVGIGGGYTSGGDNFNWNGRISTTSIYAKELSDGEVLQNYYGAPNIPSDAKIIVNRAQKGITIDDSGIGVDLARVYDNTQPWGYANSDLNGDFDGLNQFTYFLWLHCYSHHTNYSQTSFYKYAGTTTAVVRLYDFGNYNGGTAGANNRFYANRGGSWGSISGNFTMDVGETACICLQYDSTNGGDLWKNGVKISTGAGSGTIATNTSSFGIITPEYGGNQYVKVKEAYVYTKKLTDKQIVNMYSATKMKYNV